MSTQLKPPRVKEFHQPNLYGRKFYRRESRVLNSSNCPRVLPRVTQRVVVGTHFRFYRIDFLCNINKDIILETRWTNRRILDKFRSFLSIRARPLLRLKAFFWIWLLFLRQNNGVNKRSLSAFFVFNCHVICEKHQCISHINKITRRKHKHVKI